MSKKLDTQTKNVSGVLNFPLTGDIYEDMEIINEYILRMTAYFRTMAVEWACIVHWSDSPEKEALEECDSDLEKAYFLQGTKIPHLHFVYRAEKRARLSTWIYILAEMLGYSREQRNLVSVEVCKCFPFAIQYLTHLNYPEKCQYSVENIMTNLSKDRMRFYMESDGTYIDPHTLLQLVMECSSQTEIILRIGLETYMRFRPAITTMFVECKQNPALLYEPVGTKGEYKKA